MKTRKYALIVATVLLVGVAAFLFMRRYGTPCAPHDLTAFVHPEGYTGLVIVAFGVPNGMAAGPADDDGAFYEVTDSLYGSIRQPFDDGVLLSRDSPWCHAQDVDNIGFFYTNINLNAGPDEDTVSTMPLQLITKTPNTSVAPDSVAIRSLRIGFKHISYLICRADEVDSLEQVRTRKLRELSARGM